MYTSAIAKEITVRDIDRNYKNLHGNGKKTWEKISIYTKCIILQINKTFKCKKGVPPILVYNQYGLT